MKGAGESLTK